MNRVLSKMGLIFTCKLSSMTLVNLRCGLASSSSLEESTVIGSSFSRGTAPDDHLRSPGVSLGIAPNDCLCSLGSLGTAPDDHFLSLGVSRGGVADSSTVSSPGIMPACAHTWNKGKTRFWTKDSCTLGSFSGWSL